MPTHPFRHVIVGLAYRFWNMIDKSISSILAGDDNSELVVIENNSPATQQTIAPALMHRARYSPRFGYVRMDENITNNSLELVFDNEIVPLHNYDYITLTDFDLEVTSARSWLKEHVYLLETFPRIFSVSAPLSYENMPDGMRAAMEARHFEPLEQHDRYDVFPSGMHLTTLRAAEFAQFLEWRRKTEAHFRDRVLDLFGRHVLGKVSARSKVDPVRHLSWDLIADHSDFVEEKQKRASGLWMHDDVAPFTYFRGESELRIIPGRVTHCGSALGWHNLTIVNDTDDHYDLDIELTWLAGSADKIGRKPVHPRKTEIFPFLHFGLARGGVDVSLREVRTDDAMRITRAQLSQEDIDRKATITISNSGIFVT